MYFTRYNMFFLNIIYYKPYKDIGNIHIIPINFLKYVIIDYNTSWIGLKLYDKTLLNQEEYE